MTVALPDMTLPFPARCHPDADDIERAALDWVTPRATAATVRYLARTRAGRIVARTASPSAPRPLLDAYARFLVWGFWFDDEFVDDLPADSPLHLPAVSSVLDIMDTGTGTGAAGVELEQALAEIVATLDDLLQPGQFARWCQEMRLWFASMAFQNAMRRTSGRPPVATYRTLRRYTVASYPCVVLIDASHGPDVDWNDYHHPDLTALRVHASNVVAWQNDVFSYYVERDHPGQFWNMPTIHIAHGLSPEEAVARTASAAADEVAAFQTRAALVTPQLTPAQLTHVDSLKNWMRGTNDWSREATARYTGWDTR